MQAVLPIVKRSCPGSASPKKKNIASGRDVVYIRGEGNNTGFKESFRIHVKVGIRSSLVVLWQPYLMFFLSTRRERFQVVLGQKWKHL